MSEVLETPSDRLLAAVVLQKQQLQLRQDNLIQYVLVRAVW